LSILNRSQFQKYQKDFITLKSYNGFRHKLTLHRSIRLPGWEDELKTSPRCLVNDEKLENNIARARETVLELALCNNWELFCTLTLNGKKHERSDLPSFIKKLSQWLRDYNKKHGTKIKYLLIPELHKDKSSWHMHGFFMGLPQSHLKINKHGYLDWIEYQEAFGFISIDKIRSHQGASVYITKYISKNLSDCVTRQNAKMYYCSQNLARAETLKSGKLSNSLPLTPNYENDYVKVYWLDTPEQIASALQAIE